MKKCEACEERPANYGYVKWINCIDGIDRYWFGYICDECYHKFEEEWAKEEECNVQYIGTISAEDWNEDGIIRVFENLDGHELYIGREIGKHGFRHYQFCMDCAGDLEKYTADNRTGWHVERCISWEMSKGYCRKTGDYRYIGDSREERYYAWLRARRPLPIWRSFGASVVKQNDRSITVWVDTEGKAGKSTFSYILERRGKCLNIPRTEHNPTRLIDFVAMHYKGEPLIIVDIPRDQKLGKELCRALETIKDGVITSAKYQGTKMFIKGVKILVFTNHFLDKTTYAALTEDRWDVKSLKASKSHPR
ncbi:replication-associated protein [Odonata-associated circular virus 21]|uniref:Replication-associated protein n=1 Tax=Odonata-associated circular virus 21 TaxID=1592122 RepID=A0A0B4UGV8_9VIRU|nr:replication-associated protein [Odonata-associated circular virus 21]AJD07508.1 replication-associated protein [Odonata-associated circular virus 21]